MVAPATAGVVVSGDNLAREPLCRWNTRKWAFSRGCIYLLAAMRRPTTQGTGSARRLALRATRPREIVTPRRIDGDHQVVWSKLLCRIRIGVGQRWSVSSNVTITPRSSAEAVIDTFTSARRAIRPTVHRPWWVSRRHCSTWHDRWPQI